MSKASDGVMVFIYRLVRDIAKELLDSDTVDNHSQEGFGA